MKRGYLQEVVDSLQANPLTGLLGDRAKVYVSYHPHSEEGYEYTAVEVRVGDIRVIRRFTFEELRDMEVPAKLMAIEIATMVAMAIVKEGV